MVSGLAFHAVVDRSHAFGGLSDSMERQNLLPAVIRRAGPWRRLPLAMRVGAAALLAIITFGVWNAVSDVPTDARFIVFMPAVLLSSLLFGSGPGNSAALIGASLVLYQSMAPKDMIPTQTTFGALVIFIATSAFAAALIEALRRTVDGLSANNNLLETVIESSPEPIGVKDEIGRYVRVNAMMARLLGTQKEAVLGRHDRDLVPHDVAAAA